MVPVTVVTGFLGAGKTTLVNRWLAGFPRGDVAVIVNEHGDVGIDGELLAERARELVEITGGCVCCATQAELVRALDDLASRRVKRILVETSGAASPAGVIRAIAGGGPDGAFALDGIVTVVDASRTNALDAHDLAIEQIGYADIVVVSRADVCSREQMDEAAAFVAMHNGAALVVEGPSDESLDRVLEARRADFVVAKAVPHATNHAVYESVALTIDGEVDGDRFADFVEGELGNVAGRVFRTKGIIAVAGVEERMIVQGVADLVEVSFGEPWATTTRASRLVVVGFGLDREAIARGFAACAVTPSGSPSVR